MKTQTGFHTLSGMIALLALVGMILTSCGQTPTPAAYAQIDADIPAESPTPTRLYLPALLRQESTPAPDANPTPAPPALTSDFTPCTGYRTTDPQGNPLHGPGPWATRLLLAYSDDGLTFQRANRVLSDQADVANAITMPGGEVWVYYVTLCPDEVYNRIVVAISRDSGATWAYKEVSITGIQPQMPMLVDPTVVRTDNGRYRLYFTSASSREAASTPSTYSAISDDGLHFAVEEGVRFAVNGQKVLDPNVLHIGNTWHFFAGDGRGSNYHAISEDGLHFTRLEDFLQEQILMANGLAMDGGFRYYGFVQSSGTSAYIRSLFTTDGQSWTVEAGARLELDESTGLEAKAVKDSAVARLADGRYLMVYTTQIPGYPDSSTP